MEDKKQVISMDTYNEITPTILLSMGEQACEYFHAALHESYKEHPVYSTNESDELFVKIAKEVEQESTRELWYPTDDTKWIDKQEWDFNNKMRRPSTRLGANLKARWAGQTFIGAHEPYEVLTTNIYNNEINIDAVLKRESKEFRPIYDKLHNVQKKVRANSNRKKKKRRK